MAPFKEFSNPQTISNPQSWGIFHVMGKKNFSNSSENKVNLNAFLFYSQEDVTKIARPHK